MSGAITLNANRRALVVNGVPVDLSPQQYAAASALVGARGDVVTWDAMTALLSGETLKNPRSQASVVVCNIKSKLARAGVGDVLVTRYGLGVLLEC